MHPRSVHPKSSAKINTILGFLLFTLLLLKEMKDNTNVKNIFLTMLKKIIANKIHLLTKRLKKEPFLHININIPDNPDFV